MNRFSFNSKRTFYLSYYRQLVVLVWRLAIWRKWITKITWLGLGLFLGLGANKFPFKSMPFLKIVGNWLLIAFLYEFQWMLLHQKISYEENVNSNPKNVRTFSVISVYTVSVVSFSLCNSLFSFHISKFILYNSFLFLIHSAYYNEIHTAATEFALMSTTHFQRSIKLQN